MIEIIEETRVSIKTAINKLASRKLLVLLIATHALYADLLQGSDWIMIALLYTGTQGVIDYRKTNGQVGNTFSSQRTSE